MFGAWCMDSLTYMATFGTWSYYWHVWILRLIGAKSVLRPHFKGLYVLITENIPNVWAQNIGNDYIDSFEVIAHEKRWKYDTPINPTINKVGNTLDKL